MGTVFNNENSHLFKVLVEACKHYAQDYAVIVSTGDLKTYDKYAHTALNSSNILLVPHTPQVEILKRAHLFITHAGMNSVSEAINYGVPIICLPLSGDQPFVAWRVADDLRLGVRLEPNKHLRIDQVRQAIEAILNDPEYRDRARKLATVSKSYAGHRLAAEETVHFIKKNEALMLLNRESESVSKPLLLEKSAPIQQQQQHQRKNSSVFFSQKNGISSFSPSPSSISANSSKTSSWCSLNEVKKHYNNKKSKKTIVQVL